MITTLEGDRLFEHYGRLSAEIKSKSRTDDAFEKLMHSQLANIFDKHMLYLKKIYPDPILSFGGNGFPSIESLKSDLEAMCRLAKEDDSFKDIGQGYKKEIITNHDLMTKYKYATMEEWQKERQKYKIKKLASNYSFTINGNGEIDKNFCISIIEEIFVDGIDQISKEFPILIREGRMTYRLAWDELFFEGTNKNYIPNTNLILNDSSEQPVKKFDNRKILFNFLSIDYMPSNQQIPKSCDGNWQLRDYSQFLLSGTKSRTELTKKILDSLSSSFGTEVFMEGIDKNNLESALTFSSILFKNAPQVIPDHNELYHYNENSPPHFRHKYKTLFNLALVNSLKKIGEIAYLLPRNNAYTKSYEEIGNHFDFGKIIVEISSSSDINYVIYKKIQENMDNILIEWNRRIQKIELENKSLDTKKKWRIFRRK